MGIDQRPRNYSLNDYLVIEQREGQRYEYNHGTVYAMPGGTLDHSTICNNIAGEIRNAAQRIGRCLPFNSEMKIEIGPDLGKRYVYADAGAACPAAIESELLTGAITNPTLIVEVLSKSSVGYDTRGKLQSYTDLPSLSEYLIIDQEFMSVQLFRRHENSELWSIASAKGQEASVELRSLNSTIPLADIYRLTGAIARTAAAEEE